jgi:thioester reductase-like protein
MAGSRGLPVTIYRVGRVTGHSRTGSWNTDDMPCRLVKGGIQLGAVPNFGNMILMMTPVDYVSQALVYLSRQSTSAGGIFHLSNPNSISWQDLVNWVNKFGYPIQQLPYAQWRQKLLTSITQHPHANALQPLLPIFLDVEPDTEPLWFDCQQALAALEGSSVTCPPIDDALLRTYFSYFIRSGFLDSPIGGVVKESEEKH